MLIICGNQDEEGAIDGIVSFVPSHVVEGWIAKRGKRHLFYLLGVTYQVVVMGISH